MAFSVSDDKSAYATLKGLVEQLEEDANTAKTQRALYSERSQDYARADGAMGAYNLTISLIQSLDVWHEGVLAEKEAKRRIHLHAWDTMRPHMEPYLLFDKADLDSILVDIGYRTMFDATLEGDWCFDKCTKLVEECKNG